MPGRSWIFAYGSLMWDDALETYERAEPALLEGYRRDFNKASVSAWGCSEHPAPVLGLEEGGECRGIAYRVGDDRFDDVLASLEGREGPSYSFEPVNVQLLEAGEDVEALVAVNERNHTYIGDIPFDGRVAMATRAEGEKGTGVEYVRSTAEELRDVGVEAPHVERFAQAVERAISEH